VADEGVEPPPAAGQRRAPGWHSVGAAPNEQMHWDGQRWTARRWWVRSAWVDVPMDEDQVQDRDRAPDKRRHRWTSVVVVALVLAVVAVGALAFALTRAGNPAVPPKSTSASTSTAVATPTSVAIQQASAAQVAACESDAKVVEVALAAYQAQKGAYPAPSAPWSAATYAGNYAPLTSAAGGGPYLDGRELSTAHFVVEYDASGHVWVAPPGAYDAYNHGQDFEANPDVCLAAVG
jgi:hypothetical protein